MKMPIPNESMVEEAQRGLAWRREFGRGGTAVGIARARDISNGVDLPMATIRRMKAYFDRHEVDKEAQGFRPGEDGYPSNGRIAWALWGGDPGQTWANRLVAQDNEEERSMIEERPYANEHAARLTDPAQYDGFARVNDQFGPGIDAIFGIKDGESELQAIRFDADRFTADEAREWLAEHDYDPIEFEEATGEDASGDTSDDNDEDEMAAEERKSIAKLNTRAMTWEASIDQKARTALIAVSSEAPVERYFGTEILNHEARSIDLTFMNSGRAPLLLDHDATKQIGVVESVTLDESTRRLRAKVRFGRGELASEVFQDVSDGIRSNISVGYEIRKMDEVTKGEFRVMDWSPLEISIVSIPADQTVGVGRSKEMDSSQPVIFQKEEIMSDVNLDQIRSEAAAKARQDASAILALAARHNRSDLGRKAIEEGTSIEAFRGQLLDAIGNDKPLDTRATDIGASRHEQKEYSLARALRAMTTNDWRQAGFEREVSDTIARSIGRDAKGIFVPDFVWGKRAGPMSTAATGGSASENVSDKLVPTIQAGDMFIEALRNRMVMADLGVTFMNGLVGKIQIPKFSAGANAAFVEELAAVSDQSPTDAAVTLQPRTLGAYVDISRLLMMTSVPAVDQIVRNDLLASMAERIEYYAINGSGSSGQPTGLLNLSGINDIDISAGSDVDSLTWADIVALVKAVEEDNGVVNPAALGWLTHPAVKAKLASTAKVSSTDSVMILAEPWNSLYGYKFAATAAVPTNLDPGDGGNDASALIFGDFSQLMVGTWGAPEILVDPYTGGTAGTVRIIVMQEVDVAARNAVSFALTNEVSVA